VNGELVISYIAVSFKSWCRAAWDWREWQRNI